MMLKFVTLILSLLFTLSCHAEQFVTHGDYIIYYSALNTTMLQPEIAKAYKITRSKNRAMLNVCVHKKGEGKNAQSVPVTATVTAQAANLTQQLKKIKMKTVVESDATYYIGVFPITNEEKLDFTISAVPEQTDNPREITFKQQFFTD